jgi:serine/threonine protein kinase
VATADPFGVVGQVLDGQFRVDKVVGEGGFSVVYKGHHLGLDEPIAVKCLKLPSALGSALVESFVRRFRDESRLHYRLSQGNLYIARSNASGTTMAPVTGALVPYMVLEWLEGKSLAEDFADRRARGLTGRTLPEIVKLLDPALDAIAYAHAQGVVHRDLNPGNLFLARTRDGTKLKVLDFGVAKVVSDHALEMGPRAVTLGHIRIFSPAYGAPEQFDDAMGKIGAWTDVYALALIILEAMRDRTVNEGEHIGEFALKALDGDNRPTPRSLGLAVGDEVEDLMAGAVALSPKERPQDAGELWGRMKHALRKDAESGKPAHSNRPPSVVPRPSQIATADVPISSLPVAVEVVRPQSAAPPPARQVTPIMQNTPRPGASTQRMSSPAPSGGARPGTSTLRMNDARSQPPAPDMSMSPLAITPGVLVRHESANPPPAASRPAALAPSTPLPFAPQTPLPPPPQTPLPFMASEPSAVRSAPRPEQSVAAGGMWMRPQTVPPKEEPVSVPRSKAPLVLLILAAVLVVGGGAAAAVFYFVSIRGH